MLGGDDRVGCPMAMGMMSNGGQVTAHYCLKLEGWVGGHNFHNDLEDQSGS